MKKGIDFVGVTVSYILFHEEKGLLASLRSAQCRDEHGKRDFGGGGLQHGETITEGVQREINEEINLTPDHYDLHFLGHREVFREGDEAGTHWIGFQHLVIAQDISTLQNNEPHKHDEVKFFQHHELPAKNEAHSQMYPMLEDFEDALKEITGMHLKLD